MAAMGASETVPAWVGENTQSRGICRRNSSGDSWGVFGREKKWAYGDFAAPMGMGATSWGQTEHQSGEVLSDSRSSSGTCSLLQRMRVV